ncbi:photosystem II biogenesis protein Psp29 [Parasynechococcus sp.]|uniref:photosystem II biogenesis protein Psp29 n=1 Tax=Parasynechococcus sp. TaxID=3101203 RepID=UPI00370487BB
MADRQTIADSKRAFHQTFPHVIAPLYRRLADELLVELHLLSHQKSFQTNALFAVGLNAVFTTFSAGYKPEEQRQKLLPALCTSNGFDGEALIALANTTVDQIKSSTSSVDGVGKALKSHALPADQHYSRMMAIGVDTILKAVRGEATTPDNEALQQQALQVAEELGLPKAKVEKDLNLYRSNSERMQQAVELMEETLAAERRKREKRDAESAQNSAS